MNRKICISLSKITAALLLSATLYIACTPKKLSNNTGDDKAYNDDSEINMKTTEKKARMPFDTTSPPRELKIQPRLQTQ